MGKKFFMKMLLVALFIAVPFTSVATTTNVDFDPTSGFEFDGDIEFDLDGIYYLGQIGYPLNVLGVLKVYKGDLLLGDLSLNAQKTSIENWDGTSYVGHWIFDPLGCGCDSKLGLLTDLDFFRDLGDVGFMLEGFDEGESIDVAGSWADGSFTGSMVPIPGALLLFGSGVLGLICIRRK